LKVVEGRLGGSLSVFRKSVRQARKRIFYLAPPLDADWLLHPLKVFEAQM
jgi:hypothetical protein